MATKYRTQTESCIYHITIRGVAKQIIFEDTDDRRFFGKRLRTYLDDEKTDLYAWCFMSNHVHLLIHASLEAITRLMRRLLISYVHYFNTKHNRTGHLFQDRFDSVPIETDEQLMAAVRYIHRNPLEIPDQTMESYEWSSYREYLGVPFISNTEFVKRLFDSQADFVSFHESWNPQDETKHRSPSWRNATDEEAIMLACKLLEIDSVTSIASFDKSIRNKCLVILKRNGLTVSQIARITGIGRNIVQRAGS